MTTSDWITLSAAGLVVAGWFVTNWLSRKNEIEKVRLKLRTDVLLSYLDIHTESKIQVMQNANRSRVFDDEFVYKLFSTLERLYYIGTIKEKELAKSMMENLSSKKAEAFSSDLNQLRDVVLKRLNKELKF